MESRTVTIYKFTCGKCKHKAQSIKEDRAEKGLCRNCRQPKVIAGQIDIYGQEQL